MKQTIFVIAFLVLISIPMLAKANDSLAIESEITPFQNQEVRIPWYKNMNYTFGYNIGTYLMVNWPDIFYMFKLNSIEAGVKIPINNRKIYVGLGYGWGNIRNYQNSIEAGVKMPINNRGIYVGFGYRWGNIDLGNYQNSIEAGVKIPINNRKIYVGLGYGWGNTQNHQIRIFDTLINGSLINLIILDFKNIKKLYIHTGYSISKSIYTGLELNYHQGYGNEEYCYESSNVFEISNVRRDLIGGGTYIKLSPTITVNKNFEINPYLMFKILASYEVHNTSPYIDSIPIYDELSSKKLNVWYAGLYGGFNFNIGGKR